MVTRPRVRAIVPWKPTPKPLTVYVTHNKKSYRVLTFAGALVSIVTDKIGVHVSLETSLGKALASEALARLKQGAPR